MIKTAKNDFTILDYIADIAPLEYCLTTSHGHFFFLTRNYCALDQCHFARKGFINFSLPRKATIGFTCMTNR